MDTTEIKKAYEAGMEQIKSGLTIGGLEPKGYFLLLPISIVMGRNIQNSSETPSFSKLQEFEQLFCKILYDTITGANVISLYPKFLGELTFMTRLQFSAKRGDFKPQVFTKLDNASQETVEEFFSSAKFIYKTLEKDAKNKNYLKKSTQQKIIKETKDVQEIGFIEWCKEKNDPDLWHLIACEIDNAMAYDFLFWVVQQDNCDRATAAHIFLHNNGAYAFEHPSMLCGLIKHICDRSEHGDGFPNNELTLSEFSYPDDQTQTLKDIQLSYNSATRPLPPVPNKLLGTPFTGRRTSTNYCVHSQTTVETAISLK